jgi:ABC-type polysaccharide/polyol phosphate transport system ATPase subunit
MSSDNPVIRVDKVGKCYHIYDRPIDRLKQSLWRGRKSFFREFWALRDVSLTVGEGETLGIVGRNGSGKSTLLQIVCGTLAPTLGTVQVNGRVAGLLELGAGFNPEFTGRENVHINASILGLSRREIADRYDEIAAFADIGDFLEQPVKVYSSGMFVRLAFAVAVHVEPRILVLDEALSVGDIAFRNKCMLKLRELRQKGTTLLFVSHDLSTVQMICDRVAWLDKGEILSVGDPTTVCQEYYVAMIGMPSGASTRAAVIPQQETGMAKFIDVRLHGWSADAKPVYRVGEPIEFRFGLQTSTAIERTVFAVSIYRSDGDWIVGQTSREANVFWPPAHVDGVQRGCVILDPGCLAPGDYVAAFAAYSDDLAICYALSDVMLPFSVRSDFPVWGKILHPCTWVPTHPRAG